MSETGFGYVSEPVREEDRKNPAFRAMNSFLLRSIFWTMPWIAGSWALNLSLPVSIRMLQAMPIMTS
ncbi:MAG: hypothetical protein R3D83_02010 [Caenibius sp.]